MASLEGDAAETAGGAAETAGGAAGTAGGAAGTGGVHSEVLESRCRPRVAKGERACRARVTLERSR